MMQQRIELPNIKKLVLPDPGMQIADADYSGADCMIVAADSECKWLLDFFANRTEKLYAYIASEHLQREITSASPEYKSYKSIVHGSNYGLGVDKLARMLNISVHSAMSLQEFYFQLCPEIKLWHERIQKDIAARGYIENIFGRRGWFLNRNDVTLFNKAYAFIPQSTIADLINHGIVNIYRNYPWIYTLMQTHDSAVCQYPIEREEEARKAILECLTLPLDYNPTLIIPADMKWSNVSLGDCEKPKKKLN